MSDPLTIKQLWDAYAEMQPITVPKLSDISPVRYIIHPDDLEHVRKCHGDPVKRRELMISTIGNPDLGWVGDVLWRMDQEQNND